MKLTRFRGQDYGKSKFREKDQEVEKVQFPTNITLKAIFQPVPLPPEKLAAIQSANKQAAENLAISNAKVKRGKDGNEKRSNSAYKEKITGKDTHAG